MLYLLQYTQIVKSNSNKSITVPGVARIEASGIGADDLQLHVFEDDLLLHDALEHGEHEVLCLDEDYVLLI